MPTSSLGRLDPARFAGGGIPLHRPRPRARSTALGALGLDPRMPRCRRRRDRRRDHGERRARPCRGERQDTADRTLIAFGGAAPLHAARLARKLGMRRCVVPVGAGVGSAHGFLSAPIGYEVVRTRHMRLEALDHGC